MPAPQFELLWSGLTRPQTHDRAVSLLRAANSREQVVKMANEYIYLVNGANLAEVRGRSGQAALASFRGPEPRAIFPASGTRHAAHLCRTSYLQDDLPLLPQGNRASYR